MVGICNPSNPEVEAVGSQFEANLGYIDRSSQKPKNKAGARGAHTCNPSYSRGRDQKDLGSKPAQANSL
jgi:hypothetical protein